MNRILDWYDWYLSRPKWKRYLLWGVAVALGVIVAAIFVYRMLTPDHGSVATATQSVETAQQALNAAGKANETAAKDNDHRQSEIIATETSKQSEITKANETRMEANEDMHEAIEGAGDISTVDNVLAASHRTRR